jgi:hypothetical protein
VCNREPKDYDVVPGFTPLTYGELRAEQRARREHWHGPPGLYPPMHYPNGQRRHLGPEYLGWRAARLLLESTGRHAYESQMILEDLAHWPPGVKRFSFKAPPYAVAWMAYGGERAAGEQWPQPYFYWRNDLPFHEHEWRDCLVGCDDCGDHPGVECDDCGEVLDLIYQDDPRETG